MAAQPRQNAAGKATAQLLLVAAERLFAEHGIDGVSMRDINQAAGQRGTATSHYHFGNKEGVVKAILATRSAESHARREELLNQLGPAPDTDTLLNLIIQPFVDDLDSGSRYCEFLAKLHLDRTHRQLVEGYDLRGSTSYTQAVTLLRDRFDPERSEKFLLRLSFAVDFAIAQLARRRAAEINGEELSFPRPVFLDELRGAVERMLAGPADAAEECSHPATS